MLIYLNRIIFAGDMTVTKVDAPTTKYRLSLCIFWITHGGLTISKLNGVIMLLMGLQLDVNSLKDFQPEIKRLSELIVGWCTLMGAAEPRIVAGSLSSLINMLLDTILRFWQWNTQTATALMDGGVFQFCCF
jgi:hypothetical protein